MLIVIVGTVGYRLNGWNWADSLYMVIITIFGIGYSETHPVESPMLRILTMGVIISGYVSIIYTVGGFAQLIIDGEIRRIMGVRRMQREIDRLKNHIVICGFGRMGSKLAESLAERGRSMIIIDHEQSRIDAALAKGWLAIHGNATEEQILRTAGVERASILTTVLSDDVANLFITLSAHELNPKLEILARAEQTSTIKKLRQVGASKVILPANIGADRLANLILRPSAESLLTQAHLPEGLNDDLASLGLRLDELEITEGSSLIGGSLADLRTRGDNRFLTIAVRTADGNVKLNPNCQQSLNRGDCVVILAHESDILHLCNRYALQSELSELSELSEETADETAPPVVTP